MTSSMSWRRFDRRFSGRIRVWEHCARDRLEGRAGQHAASGRWRTLYGGRVLRRSQLVDTDPVVPLGRRLALGGTVVERRVPGALRERPARLVPASAARASSAAAQPGSGAGDGVRRAPSQRQGEALLAARRDGAVARAVTTASSPCLVTPVAW
jgi:hypothetical protein